MQREVTAHLYYMYKNLFIRLILNVKDRPGVWQVPKGSGEQGKWRKLVAKSSVVPQRPSQLRDS